MPATARDRAEELLHTFQKRARELVDAEEGLGKLVRELVEQNGLSPTEVKKRLEEVVGRIKANNVWERLRAADAVGLLNDYRDEVERKVEDAAKRVLNSLQIATKTDLKDLAGQLATLRKKVDNLKKSVG